MEEIWRHELKHPINALDACALRTRLHALMRVDAHADFSGRYFVRSLYFDDEKNSALQEKQDGLDNREKFRIRMYNMDQSFILLEKKCKRMGLSKKFSCRLTPDECRMLISGQTDFLRESGSGLMRELHAKMTGQGFLPRVIVDYTREAYVHPLGNVRVTIDSNIRLSYQVEQFFQADPPTVPASGELILEVKYDRFLPDMIADILQLGSRSAHAFSKYAAARTFM
jgi:hypothetical protein